MIRALPVLFCGVLVGSAALPASGGEAEGESIAVPSGQHVEWMETIWDQPGPAGITVRFRFLAPAIAQEGGGPGAAPVEQDMQYLCEHYALPRIADRRPRPAQIIISLASAPVEFGAADPGITQLFEAYSPSDGICQWEGF